MSADLISLDEASWRLQKSEISGRAFAELLVRSPPLLLGIFPGNEMQEPVDLSRVRSFRVERENVVAADNVRWTDIKLDWRALCAALKNRGRPVSWNWLLDITPELLEQARQLSLPRRRLDDLRPPVALMRAAPAIPQPARRGEREWFDGAVLTGAIPASGRPPPGRRGPKSGKLENTAASLRKDLVDKILTLDALRAMPEKELAGRYLVSRDTARKARNEVLQASVEISSSTNDK